MALLYDSFGIRSVEVNVNIWPDFDGFAAGELSQLYGHLNKEDIFSACDLRSNFGARFDGEHWMLDIDSSSVTIRCSSFATPEELRSRTKELLGETRKFFANTPSRHRIAYFLGEVRMAGLVPDDKSRNVGELLRKRLIRGMNAEKLDLLTGLQGAGLRLIGDTPDFHWHASIEPPHGAYEGLLGMSIQLFYPPPPDPPTHTNDLVKVDAAVSESYAFITENIKSFANALVH